MTPAPGLTRALARYVVETDYEALPEEVRHEAARALLNWVGVAIGGSRQPAPEAAARMVAEMRSAPVASVIGHDLKTDVASAAFVNCISSSVLAYDDAHLATVAHPSGPAAAALFALAQSRRISGQEFVNALALGIEIQCRIANALVLPPWPINPSFYLNGFSGPVGVAAAAGRLIGLDEQKMIWAIGLAATQASGFRATHGTMTAHFRPGLAARNGVASALLAEAGLDCTDDALEAAGGFFDVYAPGSNLDLVTDGLGQRHEMLANRYKPYPCGIVIHPVIDACLYIRSRLSGGASIDRVRLLVNPLVVKLTGKRRPRTPLESHVSVYHWSAVALSGGAPGVSATQPVVFADPAIVALSDRIETEAVADMGKGEARVEVTLADGSILRSHVEHARGSEARPMMDAELDAKFQELAAESLSKERFENLRKACWGVACLPDVGMGIGGLLP